ncbi:hypothetical protein K7X08_014641 [Anisodus acutangulus]|uniref:Uncharacterized protein n=1 Tax=Anisodus acutangulus TaxID=402998 RepID=A0A9Q1LLI8_9SOLA|nr:hypothetical protein K7X08_014641 [Anisodus acutangulus]
MLLFVNERTTTVVELVDFYREQIFIKGDFVLANSFLISSLMLLDVKNHLYQSVSFNQLPKKKHEVLLA